MSGKLRISIRILPDGRPQEVVGRDAWALLNLLRAGEAGCTPIDTPGPRWSHYIWKLRRAGIVIETIEEAHGGAFAGHHARYILRSEVELVEQRGLAA